MHARRIALTAALTAAFVFDLGPSITSDLRTAQAGSMLLRRTVVVGDSILAGFGDGGLRRDGAMGQRNSAPRLITRRAGVNLPQPLMSAPGFPPPYRMRDKDGDRQLDRGDVVRRAGGIGFRARSAKRVHNLAVPGESVDSVFDEIDASRIAQRLASGDPDGRDIMKFAILGLPLRVEGMSQVRRAREIQPSFIIVWLGNNDVLDMATSTNPTAVDLTPAQFGARYRRLLDALADSGAPMAVLNLPDVTQIAALRRAAGEVTQCRRSDGKVAPVAAEDLLPLDLDVGTLPVPSCGHVLDGDERVAIRRTVQAFNAEIAAAIDEVEIRRGVAVARIDAFGLFDSIAASGYDVRGDGRLVLGTRYLGGIFGLDGVHPTRTGHAIIANAVLDAIQSRFGEVVARVDVARVAATDVRVRSRLRPAGEAPFGLFAPNEIRNLLPNAFRDIADHGRIILRQLTEDVGGIFARRL